MVPISSIILLTNKVLIHEIILIQIWGLLDPNLPTKILISIIPLIWDIPNLVINKELINIQIKQIFLNMDTFPLVLVPSIHKEDIIKPIMDTPPKEAIIHKEDIVKAFHRLPCKVIASLTVQDILKQPLLISP